MNDPSFFGFEFSHATNAKLESGVLVYNIRQTYVHNFILENCKRLYKITNDP